MKTHADPAVIQLTVTKCPSRWGGRQHFLVWNPSLKWVCHFCGQGPTKPKEDA